MFLFFYEFFSINYLSHVHGIMQFTETSKLLPFEFVSYSFLLH